MKNWEQRTPIYAALMLLSLVISAFLGPGAGALSFFQMTLVTELTYLIGGIIRNAQYTAID